MQLIRLLEPAPIFLKPDTNVSNTSKVSFAAATNKIRTQTLLLVLHLISSLYRSGALVTVTLCFSDGICSNIRCFLNEHEAKSFTADLLLITISSSDMARVRPCCSQGALLSITSSPSSTAASIYNQTLTQWQMMSCSHAWMCIHKCTGYMRQLISGREVSFVGACIMEVWVSVSEP